MKICQLLHAMTTGGAEVLADRMGRHFAKRNEVVYACLDGIGELGEKLQTDGFVVENLTRGSGIDFGCMRRLARFLGDQQIDVIHAHQYTPFFYAAAARTMAGGQPIVFTEHGRFHPDLPSRKRALFNRLLLRKRDRLIAVGQQVKQALIQNESLPEQRIEVIYNGVDLSAFLNQDSALCRSRLRNDLGLPETAVIVAQVARLDPIKDHPTAIRALAQAIKSQPDLHLVIVGDGPQRETLQSEIELQNVRSHVHLLGLRSDVPEILAGADILLLTSVSEGIPLTLIEGMASELPCISTDVGGVREVIEEQKTGLLAAPGDVDQLASAMVQLGNNAQLRESMGRNGAADATARFGERQMLHAYDKIFDTFTERR